MKKFFQNAKKKGVVVGAVIIAGATNAMAVPLLTAPTLNTEDGVVVAGAVLTGTAVFWGIKKGISLLRG